MKASADFEMLACGGHGKQSVSRLCIDYLL
jgi:hypothetical protein